MVRVAASTLLGFVGAIAVTAATATAEDLCLPRDDWDRAFQRSAGWTGGDADYAIDLGERTLWLFADSWVGNVADGRHSPGARLVNNALALHANPAAGAAPAPAQIEFHWGPSDSEQHPTAWVVPDRQRVKARFPRQGVSSAPTWYWVADGLLAPGPEGRKRLVVFLWHIGRTEGTGVWTFASVGGAVAVIENPNEPPERWRVAQFDNPHVVPDAGREASPPQSPVTWGSALVLVPRDVAAGDAAQAPWIYVYGTRNAGPFETQLVLARAPADAIEKFATWEFRTANGWSREPTSAASLASGVVSEFSVDRVEWAGRTAWVLVQSEPLFGTRIMARVADEPTGPFGPALAVYQVPGVDPKRKYFTYAAKAHPHLSRHGTLLVSYIINSHDFGAMINDANIYRPRFVELDVERLAAAAKKTEP
ncbi:MAG: DUF4185 domain-containing protein [Pirellulales bacterium]|nr:DUF4185 domain-containing protein [Pirellulales bacterium]